jgi:hypothetical protein
LILATQETQCVGKSGGISPVKKVIELIRKSIAHITGLTLEYIGIE